MYFVFAQVPWGLRGLLNWIKDHYGDVRVLVTENGLSEAGTSEDLNDWWRIEFYTRYIGEVLKGNCILLILHLCFNFEFIKHNYQI